VTWLGDLAVRHGCRWSRPDWNWRRLEPGAPGIQRQTASTPPAAPSSTTALDRPLDYFDNAWFLTEVLLSALQGEEAFYRPPQPAAPHMISTTPTPPRALRQSCV
jgi:hypothetical protein